MLMNSLHGDDLVKLIQKRNFQQFKTYHYSYTISVSPVWLRYGLETALPWFVTSNRDVLLT